MSSASSWRRSRVQFADAADEGRALLDRGRLRPGAVRLVGCGDRGLELGVGDGVVGLDRLAGGGIGYGIGHRAVLLLSAPCQSRSVAVQSLVLSGRSGAPATRSCSFFAMSSTCCSVIDPGGPKPSSWYTNWPSANVIVKESVGSPSSPVSCSRSAVTGRCTPFAFGHAGHVERLDPRRAATRARLKGVLVQYVDARTRSALRVELDNKDPNVSVPRACADRRGSRGRNASRGSPKRNRPPRACSGRSRRLGMSCQAENSSSELAVCRVSTGSGSEPGTSASLSTRCSSVSGSALQAPMAPPRSPLPFPGQLSSCRDPNRRYS